MKSRILPKRCTLFVKGVLGDLGHTLYPNLGFFHSRISPSMVRGLGFRPSRGLRFRLGV